MSDIEIVAVYADTHVNSTIGVMPPYTELEDGGSYRAGPVQRWMWRKWLEFWDEVEALKKELGAELYVVANGDNLDDPYFPTTRLVSKHKPTILAMGAKVHERPRQLADYYRMIRGTNAHEGVDGYYAEMLADDLDALPDPETGTASSWTLYFDAGGMTFDIQHHPQTSGRRPWTENAAAARQSAIIETEYYRSGRQPPDIACRAHNHGRLIDSGMSFKPRVFGLRPWQLTTSFGHRLGYGGDPLPIGGLVLVCQDGKLLREPIDLNYERPKRRPWKAKKTK